MARAQIIVRDFTDGINAPTISIENDNHTFTAEANGEIVDFSSFDNYNSVSVRLGNQLYSMQGTGTTPSANGFTISNVAFSSGANFTLAYAAAANGTAVGTLANPSGTTGFFDSGTATGQNAATITLTIYINGFTAPFSRTISLSKAIGGSAPMVRLYANQQLVPFNFGVNVPTVGTSTVQLTAVSTNIESGNFTWAYRQTGTTGSMIALTGAETGITVSGTNNSLLTFTHTAFATLLGGLTSSGIEFRATRSSVYDSETIDRNAGAAPAISLTIRIISGPAEYRNNITGTDTVLEAAIAVGGLTQSNVAFGTGLAGQFQWEKGGANFTPSITQQSGEGATNYRIRINASDIADGSEELIEVNISDATVFSTFAA